MNVKEADEQRQLFDWVLALEAQNAQLQAEISVLKSKLAVYMSNTGEEE